MKAINIGKKTVATQSDPEDRQPCWYANLENHSSRKKAKWVVGVKKEDKEKNQEYSFKLSKVGDVEDDKFWAYASSVDFALKIISIFKSKGKSGLAEWVKAQNP